MTFFTDVLQHDPRFHSISCIRDPSLLEPVTRTAVQRLLVAAQPHNLIVTETFRSVERQQILFRAGATQLSTVGVHHYGLAADLGLIIDGKLECDGNAYTFLRQLCTDLGLVWGGDWADPTQPHSFRDYDHIQRISVSDQPKLFSGEWYPSLDYTPTQAG